MLFEGNIIKTAKKVKKTKSRFFVVIIMDIYSDNENGHILVSGKDWLLKKNCINLSLQTCLEIAKRFIGFEKLNIQVLVR